MGFSGYLDCLLLAGKDERKSKRIKGQPSGNAPRFLSSGG